MRLVSQNEGYRFFGIIDIHFKCRLIFANRFWFNLAAYQTKILGRGKLERCFKGPRSLTFWE